MNSTRRLVLGFLGGAAALSFYGAYYAPEAWRNPALLLQAIALLAALYFGVRAKSSKPGQPMLRLLYYTLLGLAAMPLITIIVAIFFIPQPGPVLSSLAGVLIFGGTALLVKRFMARGD